MLGIEGTRSHEAAETALTLPMVLLCLCLVKSGAVLAQPLELKLDQAVIVTAGQVSRTEDRAVAMLVEEIEKRTRIRPAAAHEWPTNTVPVIAMGTANAAKAWAGPYAALLAPDPAILPAEGHTIRAVAAEGQRSPAVLVSGNDTRGVLFGVGRLLRELRMSRGRILLPAGLNLETAPRYPMRGHQMGYRPETNSYDAWTEGTWKQYIRDLAVFGTNDGLVF